jgi:hypothetical protein
MRFLRVSGVAMQRFRRHELDPIPHLRAGRQFLYDLEKVEKWAERQARRTAARRGGCR